MTGELIHALRMVNLEIKMTNWYGVELISMSVAEY